MNNKYLIKVNIIHVCKIFHIPIENMSKGIFPKNKQSSENSHCSGESGDGLTGKQISNNKNLT